MTGQGEIDVAGWVRIASDHLKLHVLQGRLPQFRTLEAASAATLGQALQEHPEIELVLLDLSIDRKSVV